MSLATFSARLMDRPTLDETYLALAWWMSLRSTCSRLQVGAVLTNLDGNTVVSVGYNGNARGLVNMCDSDTPGLCGCLHAETNALLKTPYHNEMPLTLYTTHSPCVACAKLLINSRVKRVVYACVYRKLEGLLLLEPHLELDYIPHVTPNWMSGYLDHHVRGSVFPDGSGCGL